MTRWRAVLPFVGLVVRFGLAGLLAYAGVGKLLDPAGFAEDIQNYRALPDAWAGPLALGLPVLELVVALGLLAGGFAGGASLLTCLLFVTFALAMAQAKLRGIDVECGCFGGQSRVSWWKVALNLGLASLACGLAFALGGRAKTDVMASSSRLARFFGVSAVVLALAAGGGGPFLGEALASTVKALSLEQLTDKSEVIVVGVAESASSRRHLDGKLLVTDVRVRAERVLRGQVKAGSALVVTLLGGEEGEVALSVPGEASLPLGKRALLFLYRAPRSRDLRVVGMAQGVMPIEQMPDGTTMVVPGTGSGALVERGDDGKLHPAPAALMQPEPIDAVITRVQQRLSKR